jgi:ADP-ribose pyrophosphatase YjhB (NUDIX family)
VAEPPSICTPVQWLTDVRELHAIAQEGLTYASSPYDLQRYQRLLDLAERMATALADGDPDPIKLELTEDAGYLTPKLDLRAAVHDEAGRVLLVKETADGCWSLPGGWADVNESLVEGTVREVLEESGYEVTAERLLGIYERERWGHPPLVHFTLKAVLRCRLVGGSPTTSAETAGCGWFAREEIPPLSLTRTSPQILRRVFEHHDAPGLPPDLD